MAEFVVGSSGLTGFQADISLVTDYLCIKIKIVGEGEREEGWAVDYFSLLGIPQIFLKSSCA